MKKIVYSYTLKTPVLISDFNGDTNTRHSLNYIPGSTLLGIVAGWLDRKEIDSTDWNIATLVQTEKIRFGDAVINADKRPSWPVPQGWYQKKGQNAFPPITGGDEKNIGPVRAMYSKKINLPQDEPWKAVPFAWIQLVKNVPHLVKVQRTTQTHNAIDPQTGRPDEETGGVFVYEALKEGQVFTGEILFSDEKLADSFYRAVKEKSEVALGKSLAAEYGSAEITWKAPEKVEAELPPLPDVHLVLLSDAILTDTNGIYLTILTAEWLQHWLAERGWTQVAVSQSSDYVNYFKTRLVPGFNGKWGQFRQTVPAIVRGSVFHFTLGGAEAEAALRFLLEEGIGERRQEGFGRLTATHPLLQLPAAFTDDEVTFESQVSEQKKEAKYQQWYQISGMPEAVKKAVFMNQLRNRIATKLEEMLFENGKVKSKFTDKPSNSQLQGLRNAALTAADVASISSFMAAKRGKKADRDGYWEAKVDFGGAKISLFDLFEHGITDRNKFFRFLGYSEISEEYQNYYPEAVKLFVNQFVGTLIKGREKKNGGKE